MELRLVGHFARHDRPGQPYGEKMKLPSTPQDFGRVWHTFLSFWNFERSALLISIFALVVSTWGAFISRRNTKIAERSAKAAEQQANSVLDQAREASNQAVLAANASEVNALKPPVPE
jgi:hypothetical protein